MYIKKLLDSNSLLMFNNALQAEIHKGTPQTVKLLVNTLKLVVLKRIPQCAHWTKQLKRVKRKGLMGKNGEQMMS